MTLRVYNTLSRKKEPFEPHEPGKVSMYVCGPTVYDACHIGHARSVVVFDVIVRYFAAIGFEVKYIRNFTDIDDKIIDRAKQLGVKTSAVAERYINEFYEDMDCLNVKRASVEPKATEHIAHIIRFIERLFEKHRAYQTNGDVYYAVESFKNYGALSGQRLEEMEAGARVDINKKKRNPFDFALWKSSKPGEPSWESPWGKGRPGWHIECSAMSMEYLGETFDIHGGGQDLVFPHHENEIAQSEGVSGKPFVKYWIHNGFVTINQEKMSKSLGNFLMIKDILKAFHPEVMRLFLLSNHYRSPIDFSDQALKDAKIGLDKIYALLGRLESKISSASEKITDTSEDIWRHFCDAMDDDFNTAKGIALLFETVRKMNRIMDASPDNLSPQVIKTLRSGYSDIKKIGKVLGLFTQSPNPYFEKSQSRALEKKSMDPAVIQQIIHERTEARQAKEWAKADEIRKRLEDMGIILEDRPGETVWKIK